MNLYTIAKRPTFIQTYTRVLIFFEGGKVGIFFEMVVYGKSFYTIEQAETEINHLLFQFLYEVRKIIIKI